MMQKIEITNVKEMQLQLYCPFCGEVVLNQDKGFSESPCAHTKYIVTDDDLIYSDAAFGLVIDQLMENEFDGTYDQLTDSIEGLELVKWSLYSPAPSLMGVYVGFSPS